MINTFEDLERLIKIAKENKIGALELQGAKFEFSQFAFLDSYKTTEVDTMVRESISRDLKEQSAEEEKDFRETLFASAE